VNGYQISPELLRYLLLVLVRPVSSLSKSSTKPVYSYTVMEKMPLTDEQIEAIAERAAEVAFKKIYEEVGRSVVKRIFWIVGAGSLALLFWLSGNGNFPKV
jgi:hypothetical protein